MFAFCIGIIVYQQIQQRNNPPNRCKLFTCYESKREKGHFHLTLELVQQNEDRDKKALAPSAISSKSNKRPYKKLNTSAR